MVRIWAKVIKNGKIIKQFTFERIGAMDYSLFFDFLCEICGKLDIPTPVLMKTNIFNYAKYNNVKFKEDDFMEKIDFDKLILENALF